METSREYKKRFGDMIAKGGSSASVAKAECKLRHQLADAHLRPLLKPGDKLRATKAECGSKEGNFKFSHWHGGWIISTGDASIGPGSVYSVNGEILKFDVKGKTDAQPQNQEQTEEKVQASVTDTVSEGPKSGPTKEHQAEDTAGSETGQSDQPASSAAGSGPETGNQPASGTGNDVGPGGIRPGDNESPGDGQPGGTLQDPEQAAGGGADGGTGLGAVPEGGQPKDSEAGGDSAQADAAGDLSEGAAAAALKDDFDPDAVEQQTVFDNPEEFEPLTENIALRAGFRAQRAVARAMMNDQDADCLSFEQCELMSHLVRKSPKCSVAALLKHLELCSKPTDLGRIKAECLAGLFRSSFLAVDSFQAEIEALKQQPAKTERPIIPPLESSLQLVDEPLALSETAKRMKRKAS